MGSTMYKLRSGYRTILGSHSLYRSPKHVLYKVESALNATLTSIDRELVLDTVSS